MSLLKSGHLAICFSLSMFLGCSGSASMLVSSSIGSTGSFVMLIFGLGLVLCVLDLGLSTSCTVSS